MRALTQESGVKYENIFVLGSELAWARVSSRLRWRRKPAAMGYSAFYTRAAALFRKFALAQGDAGNFHRAGSMNTHPLK